ncbi:MAG: aspartyl/asparaginyl beta-hydroxylase domain-containing protein [Candidatus Dadabacteria bacterium]|nr:aspartyl/asparaginyl beta-hydroxylase domain-containing protein [Candidatus Dadabacteria bacterium]NIS10139.1 aspartyl/asparaginyl beta-hydroxylase domain-containing protein [Candidatus Dadabacteria bacterium]NIY23061.1 aspartyl/asparaginyl beta-hydroxylase domain-containing protein [Candidatus Dadabacteria bacterium]
MSNDNTSKGYNPPKKYAGGLSSFINWAEGINEKHSIHGNPPVYDNSEFLWVKEVEDEWLTIRSELEDVMKHRTELPNFHDIMPGVDAITTDNNWKTYFLAGYGIESKENCKRCPETARILKKIPGMKTAFFSILSPNKHIPAHKGPFNGVLRYHLGLIVPQPKEKCRIRVDDQIHVWDEGQSIVFDDTYEHEVWNDTDGFRVVLFVDFVRPIKFPYNIINKFMVFAAAYIPAMQEASQNQKQWERKFYKKS